MLALKLTVPGTDGQKPPLDLLEWCRERDRELFNHLGEWLSRLQALLDKTAFGGNLNGSVNGTGKGGSLPWFSGHQASLATQDSSHDVGSVYEVLKESDQKLFELLEDWLSRLQTVCLQETAPKWKTQETWRSEANSERRVNKSYQDGPEMPTTGRHNSVQRKSFHALQYLAAGSAGTHASLDTLVNTGYKSTSEPEITPARQMWDDLVALCNINPLGKAKAPPTHLYSWQKKLWPFVKSGLFEAFFGFIIVTNSVFIAAQIEMASVTPGAAQPEVFFILATIYTWFFTVELVLRFLAGGPRILCEEEWAWLLLDIVVVASSLMEFILEMMLRAEVGSNTQQANVSTSMRLVRVLRVAKITRAIRIVRLVKFIRSLKTLLYCIGRTLRAMLWSGVLLILIMFLFSLVFTDVCTESVAALSETQLKDSYLYFRFGSLEDSMHTLFASITGGLTWSEVSDALAEVDGIWRLVFEAYIAFCLFAVLNVMTGVFCQSAIESAERDHELILQNVAQEKQKYFRAVRRLFSQLDRNEDGGITVKEFKAAMRDPSLLAVFDALEINAGDAWALFTQLDRDGDCEVSVEEFLEGCMLLKGPARSIDVVSIKRDLFSLQEKLERVLTDFTDVKVFVAQAYNMTRAT
mmetsp:Transcript_8158/g.19463  ORF Transcript_8158/g.19463 Transcript_8158/m.19463 type:complete len:637 (-) Transcript_8158:3-1913(-)